MAPKYSNLNALVVGHRRPSSSTLSPPNYDVGMWIPAIKGPTIRYSQACIYFFLSPPLPLALAVLLPSARYQNFESSHPIPCFHLIPSYMSCRRESYPFMYTSKIPIPSCYTLTLPSPTLPALRSSCTCTPVAVLSTFRSQSANIFSSLP